MNGAVAAIIVAAGQGTRLGDLAGARPVPKAFRMVNGRTLVQRSVDVLTPFVDQIVIAVPPDRLHSAAVPRSSASVVVTPGGASRQQSVANALDRLSDDVRWVLVHDAARALVPPEVVRRVLSALHDGACCVVPAIAPHDSLRQGSADGGNSPLDRSRVWLVQTPQGFSAEALRRGHALAATDTATDDATLVEATGEAVTLVEGDPRAFKITHPLDLELAEALLSRQS